MLSRMEAGVTAKEEEAVNSMAFLEERDIKENKKFAGGSQRGNIGVDQQRKLRKIMVPEGVDFICIHETKAEEIKKNVCCAI